MPINKQLQTLINGIGDTSGRTVITNLLNRTPELLAKYNTLAAGGDGVEQLTKIEFNPKMSDKTGFFQGGVIHIGLGYVADTNGIIPAKLADLMGHEGQHGIFSPESQTAFNTFRTSVITMAASGGPHDYTDILLAKQAVNMRDEGKADISGWNASVAAERAELGHDLGEKDLKALVGKTLNDSFFTFEGILKPGFTLDPVINGQILATDPGNIAKATEQYSGYTPSTNNGQLTEYTEYYTALDLNRICQAESGKSFSIDYSSLRLDIIPDRYSNIPFSSTLEANDLLIRAGLLDGQRAGATCSIANTADGSISNFAFDGNRISVSVDTGNTLLTREQMIYSTRKVDDKTVVTLQQSVLEKHYDDNSVVRDILDYNPDGNQCTHKVITLSADQRTAVENQDLNLDGEFEKTITTVDADLHGHTDTVSIATRETNGNRTVEVFDYEGDELVNHEETTYTSNGILVQRTIYNDTISSPTGPAAVTVYDGAGNEIGRGSLNTYEDGSTSQTIKYTDGRIIRTNTDQKGELSSRASIETTDNGTIETVSYTNGRIVKLSYDGDRKLLSQEEIQSASLTLKDTLSSLVDAISLLKAIQTGQPLPIVASGLRLANGLVNPSEGPVTNLELSGAANAASGIISLLSLNAALERGDTLSAISAGSQAISFGAKAYADFADFQLQNVPVVGELAASLNKQLFADLPGSNALAFIGLVDSIARGDAVGAAISVIGMINPALGLALSVARMMFSLLGDDNEVPDPWGTGHFVWDGNGISISSAGETGGNEAVGNVMNNVLATLNALIVREQQQNPNVALGVIPNRMPGVGYDMSGFRYTAIDPLTGAESHPALRFDTAGRPYNAEAGTPESYQSLTEGLIRSALARGALAPLWEVQTAKLQTDAGDPKAGLTEEERAGRDGQLAAAITGTTQVFRPVALDMDGDGIEVTDKAHGTAFDVDDSGFFKQTAWVKSDDAMLTLDRNYNGSIDSGRELFSNATVALGRRGLAGMAWVDSNYDGKLSAADPVWSELKVWRDLDQDGVQETGESQSLSDLGISELNYAMSTFTQAGQAKQLGSPDLEADKDGTRVTVVPEGILVLNSADNKLSLVVTQIDDETLLEPNRDGITGYEDTEVIVGSTDLLANDTLGGIPGSNLQITSVSNFRHGTGYLDANGFVHFNPEANYNGTGAGFEYAMAAVNDGRFLWAA